jgi:hypothetical protein
MVEWLPIIKSLLELTLYALFPVVILLAILPDGFNKMGYYAKSLMWIAFWHPMFVIINKIFYLLLESNLDVSGTVNIASIIAQSSNYSKLLAASGYMFGMIPYLSLILLRGLDQVVHMGASFVQSLTHAANHPAEEAITGNIHLGNSSTGNHHANNITRNHVDLGSHLRQNSTFQDSDGFTKEKTVSGKPKNHPFYANNITSSNQNTVADFSSETDGITKSGQGIVGLNGSLSATVSSSPGSVAGAFAGAVTGAGGITSDKLNPLSSTENVRNSIPLNAGAQGSAGIFGQLTVSYLTSNNKQNGTNNTNTQALTHDNSGRHTQLTAELQEQIQINTGGSNTDTNDAAVQQILSQIAKNQGNQGN